MIRAVVAWLVTLGTLGLAMPAVAETRRVAVVVGNNAGDGNQPALRYAEVDAGKIGRVLVELGGVMPADLFLLQGKDLASLDETLRRAKARIAAYHRGLDRVIVIFYYSGHSDGIALELGGDRFTFAALRTWLKDTGADIRLGLVDSCKSGALLAMKGGTPAPAFQLRLTDDLSSTGEALLTSSAADENALESREIGGSFFTHHLVSGLRGAADTSGDDRVTLTEAYRYAYEHTIAMSGNTVSGSQHPAYDYRLSGQGELILTELTKPTAGLALPVGFERALVIDAGRDQVIAELGRGAPRHVAVLPGRYTIRAWQGTQAFEGTIAITGDALRAVRWDELRTVSLTSSRAKGGGSGPREGRYAFGAAAGVRAGIASQLDALGSLRIGVRSSALRGPSLALDAGTRQAGPLRETSAFVFGGYHLGWQRGPLRAWAGLELGAGAVIQKIDSSQGPGKTASTGAVAAGPVAGVSLTIHPKVAFSLEGHVPAIVLKQDREVTVVTLPAAWLGLIITP